MDDDCLCRCDRIPDGFFVCPHCHEKCGATSRSSNGIREPPTMGATKTTTTTTINAHTAMDFDGDGRDFQNLRRWRKHQSPCKEETHPGRARPVGSPTHGKPASRKLPRSHPPVGRLPERGPVQRRGRGRPRRKLFLRRRSARHHDAPRSHGTQGKHFVECGPVPCCWYVRPVVFRHGTAQLLVAGCWFLVIPNCYRIILLPLFCLK